MPFGRTFLSAVCLLFPISFVAQAKADTYSIYTVFGSSGSSSSDGLTDSGFNVVSTQVGYHIFNGATGVDTITTIDPRYTYDNGKSCTVSDTGAFQYISQAVCNNGRLAFIGSTDSIRQGVFTGFDPVKDLVFAGDAGYLQLDALGDLSFVAFASQSHLTDNNIYAFDTTSRVTPEPSSLLLMGTGVCTLLGLRRRK